MRKVLMSALMVSICCVSTVRAQSWEERMWLQLNKKMTVDLVDTKLTEACNLVAQISGVTLIIDPKVRTNDTLINLRVKDMDSGTFIKWLTKLSGTYAQIKDHAIFITDKQPEEEIEGEKNELAILAATMKAEITLPAPGIPLTDADRVQIALKLMEKEEYKPTDFPGPCLLYTSPSPRD